ncbi:MAG: uroporphyrinogen decarboxylase family protein [Promethearchaeota archaeon]
MKLKKSVYYIKKPWFLKVATRMTQIVNKISDALDVKSHLEFERNKIIYENKKKRVLDAITMRREPDRVPVAAGGLNFFPAKYAGITCAEYMFDYKKMKAAYLKMNNDFNLDLTFPSFMLSIGRLITAAQINLIKIPGRDIDINSSYQYNEFERLKQEEYDIFLKEGISFLFDKIAPRISNLFSFKPLKRMVYFTRVLLEVMKFGKTSTNILKILKAKGHFNLMTGFAFPPFDIMSFMLRDLKGLTRDMMKKQIREKLIELCDRMEKWLTPLLSALPQMNGSNGIFFPSERAFSLSPRQFETYYWPTLKKMIIAFVKNGNIPFLVWESDVTHLVHFLLELPKTISRRCCFMCDTSDIFKVNKILDGHMCIMGNIPLSIMCVGTPKDVEKYCEKMFKQLKPGGGFINCSALGIPDEAKPENVRAMINYTIKYGKYT